MKGALPPPVRRVTTLWLLIALSAGSLAAQALKAPGPDGDLLLVNSGGSQYLEDAGGRLLLPLAANAQVTALVAAGDEWFAAAVDPGAHEPLLVLRGRQRQVTALSPPPLRAAVIRSPQLLLRDDALGALVWLEGEGYRRLRVRGARWLGDGWAEPVTLAPRGPGSQLALTAVTLADGSWLLAWSAYDGEDNEILWSRWRGAEPSPSQRLAEDNRVPDITPHLMATNGGALAAWSRYDGNDYRVMVASFDGVSWSPPVLVGPRGSLYPRFGQRCFSVAGRPASSQSLRSVATVEKPSLSGEAASPLLIFQQAVPASWWVIELTAEGRLRRQASVATGRDERPSVTRLSSDEVLFEWFGDLAVESATLWLEAAP